MKKEPADGRDEVESDDGDQVVYRVVDGQLVRAEGAVDDGGGDWSGHTETADPAVYPGVGVRPKGAVAADEGAAPRTVGPDDDDWFAEFSDERLLAVLADPTHVGMGRFPARLTEDQWLLGALQAMDRVGPEVFLRALLAHLHTAYPAFPLKSPSN
jgi:hypothetical protein